jgi:hypothetical protein
MTKQIKPEEMQSVPPINYYASKEDLVVAIYENNRRLREESDKKFEKVTNEWKEEFNELKQETRQDFRWLIGVMITGFISLLVGLYLKH